MKEIQWHCIFWKSGIVPGLLGFILTYEIPKIDEESLCHACKWMTWLTQAVLKSPVGHSDRNDLLLGEDHEDSEQQGRDGRRLTFVHCTEHCCRSETLRHDQNYVQRRLVWLSAKQLEITLIRWPSLKTTLYFEVLSYSNHSPNVLLHVMALENSSTGITS